MDQNYWKKCSSCKNEIGFSTKYYVCNVSTCNSKRTGLVFCSVACFDRHLPGARHKDAYALEEHSPSKQQYLASSTEASKPTRRIITAKSQSDSPIKKQSGSKEVLIVASKLKSYVKDVSDMNTSAQVMNVLSDKVRQICDDAIQNARSEGRKTLLDRDFK